MLAHTYLNGIKRRLAPFSIGKYTPLPRALEEEAQEVQSHLTILLRAPAGLPSVLAAGREESGF